MDTDGSSRWRRLDIGVIEDGIGYYFRTSYSS